MINGEIACKDQKNSNSFHMCTTKTFQQCESALFTCSATSVKPHRSSEQHCHDVSEQQQKYVAGCSVWSYRLWLWHSDIALLRGGVRGCQVCFQYVKGNATWIKIHSCCHNVSCEIKEKGED